jgi:O-antigen/teichoic acid export membrane protein
MASQSDVTVKGILRYSVKFNAANIIAKALSFLTTIVIAVVLMPEDYGVLSLVGLWSTYAALIDPGMDSAAQREMPFLLGKGEEERALHLQNIAISGKILFSLLPFLVVLSASFFYSDELTRNALIITAISFIVTANTKYWIGFNYARQRFNKVVIGNLITGIVTPALTLALVFWLKLYAVLIVPIIGTLLAFFYYLKKADINYHFKLNWRETVALMKIGLPLVLLTLVYWSYRIADKTMIATYLPLRELGIYSFAVTFIMVAISFFSDFANVLQPTLWTSLGKTDDPVQGFKPMRRIAVYISIMSAISIGVFQFGFFILAHFITTKYLQSIPVFNVLAFNIFSVSMAMVPNLVLNSSVVNKQTLNTLIWAIGLVLNIILYYVVITMGLGIVGVAWAAIGMQTIITLILFFVIRRYMLPDKRELGRFVGKIFFPFLVSLVLYLVSLFLKNQIQSTYLYLGSLFALFLLAWLVVIRLFYQDYFPKEKILDIFKKGIFMLKNMRL